MERFNLKTLKDVKSHNSTTLKFQIGLQLWNVVVVVVVAAAAEAGGSHGGSGGGSSGWVALDSWSISWLVGGCGSGGGSGDVSRAWEGIRI
jgi:hypothetical protein